MENRCIEKKKRMFWFITLGYIAFQTCFAFPYKNMTKDYTYSDLFMFVMPLVQIGIFFVALLKMSLLKVYMLTLLFTVVGLGARYFLEFGEVSNTINFTIKNVCVSLFVTPLFVTGFYGLFLSLNEKNKQNT